MDTQENAQAIADILNELLAADHAAAQAVYTQGVPCNAAVANHPKLIVNPVVTSRGTQNQIRILGILNGLFSEAHRVAAVTEDGTGKLVRFDVVDLRPV